MTRISRLGPEEEESLRHSSDRNVVRRINDKKKLELGYQSWTDMLEDLVIPLTDNETAANLVSTMRLSIPAIMDTYQDDINNYLDLLSEKYHVSKTDIRKLNDDDYHRIAICHLLGIDLDTNWNDLILEVIKKIFGTTDINVIERNEEIRNAIFYEGESPKQFLNKLHKVVEVLSRDDTRSSSVSQDLSLLDLHKKVSGSASGLINLADQDPE